MARVLVENSESERFQMAFNVGLGCGKGHFAATGKGNNQVHIIIMRNEILVTDHSEYGTEPKGHVWRKRTQGSNDLISSSQIFDLLLQRPKAERPADAVIPPFQLALKEI